MASRLCGSCPGGCLDAPSCILRLWAAPCGGGKGTTQPPVPAWGRWDSAELEDRRSGRAAGGRSGWPGLGRILPPSCGPGGVCGPQTPGRTRRSGRPGRCARSRCTCASQGRGLGGPRGPRGALGTGEEKAQLGAPGRWQLTGQQAAPPWLTLPPLPHTQGLSPPLGLLRAHPDPPDRWPAAVPPALTTQALTTLKASDPTRGPSWELCGEWHRPGGQAPGQWARHARGSEALRGPGSRPWS